MSVDEALLVNERTLQSLAQVLSSRQKDDEKPLVDGEPEILDVNIVADYKTPYELLKKVLATCVDAKYGKVSLAVRALEQGASL